MQCMQCLKGSVTEDALWPYRRIPTARTQVKQDTDSKGTVQEQERLDTAVNSDQISNDTDFQNQSLVRESDTESVISISKQDNSILSSDTVGESEGEPGGGRESILKFQSLNFDHDIQDIFKTGSATSISTHDKFIALRLER